MRHFKERLVLALRRDRPTTFADPHARFDDRPDSRQGQDERQSLR